MSDGQPDDDEMDFATRSFLFQCVDHGESQFDEESTTIHFRAAARSGYYDFGVSRKRLKDLRGMLEDKLQPGVNVAHAPSRKSPYSSLTPHTMAFPALNIDNAPSGRPPVSNREPPHEKF